MIEDKSLELSPHNPWWWEVVGKIVIWLIVWIIVSIITFLLMIVFAKIFKQAIDITNQNISWSWNPVLPLILIIIAFLSSIMWNSFVWLCYNLLFSNKYYDLGKILKSVSLLNIILFFLYFILYRIFSGNFFALYLIFWFHLILSIFISITSIEITSNPNYSLSHLIWWTSWFVLTLFIFWLIYKIFYFGSMNQNSIYILMLFPPILAFTTIPLLHSIWEKIYNAFYEMWNNFLYVPSISEVLVDENEVEEVNVEE